ncbi:MAG TPA: methionine--tRNA ligase [Gemmatimonadaceae bacterium]|nr:methionine--tRNA ligase [Gemmatimonadaceae bacterium]
MSRFYITTAIDYANGDPHIGHAFEKIGADAIARAHRQLGADVHFMIGMDEHGQKVAQTAAAAGVSEQEFVDGIARRFQDTWTTLQISHDQFIRTTSAEHKAGVHALIERIFARTPDAFYEKSYSGWYCVGCESFKTDSEIVDGRCVLHPTRELEWVEERNWFFRLSAYADRLRALIEGNAAFVQPSSRRNEILGLLDSGLEDVSASRSRNTWAVPFPRPTSDGQAQSTYVWFDALPNYLTGTGFPDHEGWNARWPAQVHVIGKDITRFHCVIWPAMLMAADLPLPERVWGHGFVLLGGERFSKSAGVKLDLGEAVDRFGADAFRYFLLREIPFDGDGSFSWERFGERYNADLANAFGNLASRVTSMIEKYNDRVIPPAGATDLETADLADFADAAASLDGSRGYLLHDALAAIWRTTARANEYVQSSQPWALAKVPEQRDALLNVLGTLGRSLARQAIAIAPFMPTKAQALWEVLGAPGLVADRRWPTLEPVDAAGWRVSKGEPLFPREEPAK